MTTKSQIHICRQTPQTNNKYQPLFAKILTTKKWRSLNRRLQVQQLVNQKNKEQATFRITT